MIRLPAFWCSPTVNETGNPSELDYCTTQFPLGLSVQTGTTTPTIFGQVFEAGVTEANGASSTVTAQLGYGPLTANPEYEFGWTWFNAGYNLQLGNNDEYQLSFVAPAVGTYAYAYRFSLDGGQSWTYCDGAASPDFGAGSNAGLLFDLVNVPLMTVTP